MLKVKRFFKKIGENIVFIPGVFGLAGVILAGIMYYLESQGISEFLIEKTPFLVVNNYDTASTLLSTFSSGVLSILVFSFSMVMLMLNQAGNNFSPRVLPGLISVKKHQYIIGLFLGSILYCANVLIGLEPSSDKYQLPGFSVLLGMILTVICLFAFIYFIDSISRSIQVQNILSNIFAKAKARILTIQEENSRYSRLDADLSQWQKFAAHKTGYLQNIDTEALLLFAEEHNLKIYINQLEGQFIMENEFIGCASGALDEEDVKALNELVIINKKGEDVSENYLYGIKQITEIGVRAMSPGINDPATAINTIDHLTELLSYQMNLESGERIIKSDKQSDVYIAIASAEFKDILYQLMVSYRTYCKHDMSCMQRLFRMLHRLKNLPQVRPSHRAAIKSEINRLWKDAEDNIYNEADLKILKSIVERYPDQDEVQSNT